MILLFGGNGQLRSLCREQNIDEVLISSSQFSAERVKEILRDCEEERVVLKRMRIEIEQLSEEE